MDLRSIIRSRIAELKKQGDDISQSSVADAVGIHPVTLSRFLTNKTNLSSDPIEALLDHLKLDVVVNG